MKPIKLLAIVALAAPFMLFGDHFAQAYTAPESREVIILECDGTFSRVRLVNCPT